MQPGGELELRAERVLTPTGVLTGAVLAIRGTQITQCRVATGPVPPEVERLAGWVVPGFVDTHVHGGGGAAYATDDPDLALRARAFHRAHGTTTTFASLVTAPVEVLCRQLAALAGLVEAGELAGLHLEGPFLSPQYAGAHDAALLRHPDPATIGRLLEAGRGALQMVTLAPELPGALPAVRSLIGAGVRVALGHTGADPATVAAALDAGASVATHLFNAMRPIHHRDPGPVPRLLTDERVAVELIADGVHLHPAVLELAVATAGVDRVHLVTDAVPATGRPDGAYALGGLPVRVQDGRVRLVDTDGTAGAIAGSTLTMAAAFRQLTAALGDVGAAAVMASTNPARHFGLTGVGRIEVGARADLCLVDEDGVLLRVMQAGAWLPAPRLA